MLGSGEKSPRFICLCGRKYRSYSAAYLHIKNKHGKQKRYISELRRPQRSYFGKGRPSLGRKNSKVTSELVVINLLETHLLKLLDQLSFVPPQQIILHKDLQVNPSDLQESVLKQFLACPHLKSLLPQLDLTASHTLLDALGQDKQNFFSASSQHLTSKYAAKFLITLWVKLSAEGAGRQCLQRLWGRQKMDFFIDRNFNEWKREIQR